MSQFVRATDTAYALRFLRLLTMPVEKTTAFKQGLIDKKFKRLKKAETAQEKAAYSIFHRLVYNIRGVLAKAPGGRFINFASALFLLKEKYKITDEQIAEALGEEPVIIENNLFINSLGYLGKGNYILNKELMLPITCENLIQEGSSIVVNEDTKPCGEVLGVPVFRVWHEKTKCNVYITQEDIKDV
tara:strand:- start:309 stop:869 length:561 start_codon:yes stop_codon:yes gene_type:complete